MGLYMLFNLLKGLLEPSQLSNRLPEVLVKVPKYALKPMNIIPEKVQQTLLSTVLSKVLTQALANEELAFLQNNWLHIDITDVPFHFYISVNENNKLLLQKQLDQEANVRFAGDSQSMLQLMSRNIDPDTLFFQRKLLVTGDTELGLEIKNFLDDMDLSQLPNFIQSALQKYNELAVSN